MKKNQLNKGQKRRVMYVENKDGLIDEVSARIGWVTFSKTGYTVYYRDKSLARAGGGGVRGNHYDVDTGEEYWVSGLNKRYSNTHPVESAITVKIDDDALEEYDRICAR